MTCRVKCGRPVPAPDSLVLANIPPEPLGDAMRAQSATNVVHAHVAHPPRRQRGPPPGASRPGCAFSSARIEPVGDPTFIVLRDTAEDPRPETDRALPRLMLASRTND